MSAVEELRLLKALVQDFAQVCNAVARGDLYQKISHMKSVPKGSLGARLSFSMSKEVRQAFVPDVQGMKVLTNNVNLMAMNLTNQVGSIVDINTNTIVGGDLTKVGVRGVILELKETVNGMTESLSVFVDEVTRVAREVGTEGKLEGQARVTNVGGTWKDLNVVANNVARGWSSIKDYVLNDRA